LEAKALVYTLADTLAEAKAKALGHTLGDVGDVALVEKLADTLEVAEAKALGVKLGDMIHWLVRWLTRNEKLRPRYFPNTGKCGGRVTPNHTG